MTHRYFSLVLRICVTVLSVIGVVILYWRWLHVNPTTVALTFLILVLILASEWGLRYALFAAALATLSFNFFFLPPFGTFTVADPQNWIALFAFLVSAIVGSRLSERIRTEASLARAQRQEMEQLFRLSRELLQTEHVTDVLRVIPQAIADHTLAAGVVIHLLDSDRDYVGGDATIASHGQQDFRSFASLPHVEISSEDGQAPDSRRAIIPLRVGLKPRGVLLLAGTSLSVTTLEALGGLVAISLDRAEALERATKSEAAKESERLRTALLDSITHELRTPLTAIKASATALQEEEHVAPAVRADLVAVINEESDRLNRLVGEAVQMAQLDSHEIRMELAAEPVPALIQQALSEGGQAWKDHRLVLNLPGDLPEVLADREWVSKAIRNLIHNAAKYSDPGTEILVSAELRPSANRSEIEVAVADHGSGIAALEQEMIFDKFYRSPTVQVSGTGMGLAIVKAIVEQHGGKVGVVSQQGAGSIFWMTLRTAPRH